MRIVIIEDEARIAKRIERLVRELLGESLTSISLCDSVETGKEFIRTNEIDLLFLDLNLNGEDGFEVLQKMVAEPFHTVIISAYKDKAITAFEYGVLDFISKPFNEDRLAMALARVHQKEQITNTGIRFLAVKNRGQVTLIDVSEIVYVQGSGIYTTLHLNNGKTVLHDKSLEKLEQLLPPFFERIHKSYLVDSRFFEKISIQLGSRYTMHLKNGESLPIGRTRYEHLKGKMMG